MCPASLITHVWIGVVGITTALMLALALGKGLQGIWWGNSLGLLVGALSGVGTVCSVDWEGEVAAALWRNHSKVINTKS